MYATARTSYPTTSVVVAMTSKTLSCGLTVNVCHHDDQSGMVWKWPITPDSVLLAVTAAWNMGCEKLMSTPARKKRGSSTRALYWLRTPCPHMILYDAQITTSPSRLSATS